MHAVLTSGHGGTVKCQVNMKEFLINYLEKKEIEPQDLRISYSRGSIIVSVVVVIFLFAWLLSNATQNINKQLK